MSAHHGNDDPVGVRARLYVGQRTTVATRAHATVAGRMGDGGGGLILLGSSQEMRAFLGFIRGFLAGTLAPPAMEADDRPKVARALDRVRIYVFSLARLVRQDAGWRERWPLFPCICFTPASQEASSHSGIRAAA